MLTGSRNKLDDLTALDLVAPSISAISARVKEFFVG
jgi:hypothetical protein